MTRELRICVLLAAVAFGAFVVLFIILINSATFDNRCVAAGYERNTAQHELCVHRSSNGGPIFEENIGKMK